MIGALSQVCRLPVTTAVTCPTIRTHPAIVAQASATAAVMLDGKFSLGVGTGEALNEHILGTAWPTADVRLEMLEEAVEVIRALWTGDVVSHRGTHYTVDTARIYTLPEQPPPIYVTAFGPKAVDVAARIGDGFASSRLTRTSSRAIGSKPARTRSSKEASRSATPTPPDEGASIAHRLWANSGLPGELAQVLPSPRHFEQASSLVTEEMTRASVVCGREAAKHADAFEPYLNAGFDEIYVANMGPHYADMIRMYGDEVLPKLRDRHRAA